MKTQLRQMLLDSGFSAIEFALTAGMAVRKLRDTRYNLILCEYHLGEGQDGQHFLEDARHHGLLPLSTVFVMVTGESAYEKVVSAAELAPSDYILKPFSADTLNERLTRCFQKRDALLPAYEAIEVGNLREAITYCEEAEPRYPQYRIDLLRLRAEMHFQLGEAEEAQILYQRILESRAIPWARLGMAKALFMQKKLDMAEEVLQGLVAENELFMDAYDWLARTREAQGDLHDAFNIVQRAVTVSPHHTRRLRHYGNIAARTGHLEAAERAYTEVVRKGKYSDFRDPEDHVHLVKAQIGLGNVNEASNTVRDLERSMAGLDKTKMCSALSSALVHTERGDEAKARQALELVSKPDSQIRSLSSDLKGTLAKTLFSHNLMGAATTLVRDMMRNADNDSMSLARRVLEESGQSHITEELMQQAQLETQNLVAEGVTRARNGDYQGAANLMLEALSISPNNPQIQYNATVALLKLIEHTGWSDDHASIARRQINHLIMADSTNPRYRALHDFYQTLLRKYGIKHAA